MVPSIELPTVLRCHRGKSAKSSVRRIVDTQSAPRVSLFPLHAYVVGLRTPSPGRRHISSPTVQMRRSSLQMREPRTTFTTFGILCSTWLGVVRLGSEAGLRDEELGRDGLCCDFSTDLLCAELRNIGGCTRRLQPSIGPCVFANSSQVTCVVCVLVWCCLPRACVLHTCFAQPLACSRCRSSVTFAGVPC